MNLNPDSITGNPGHVRRQFNHGFARVAEGPSPGNLSLFQMRLQLDL